MAAVAGTFVKFDAVPTRKVVRITIEAPIEQADDVLRKLGGYPDPANAKWVGIAPLAAKPDNALKGGKLAQTAGILSSERLFQMWVETEKMFLDHDQDASENAAAFIRQRCGVSSRAHLDH
ncbi:MAG: hypothetical protein ACTHKQ_25675, partial [Mesorhizobium sp.]